MAASSVDREAPIAETKALVKLWTEWFASAGDAQLGEGLIAVRETGIDSLEAVFAEGLRRFDKSGEYAADGALGIVPWLLMPCWSWLGVSQAARAMVPGPGRTW